MSPSPAIQPPCAGQTPCAGDVETLARTLWGEARGEPLAGLVAVAHVVVNRARRPGWWSEPDHTLTAVCRRPWQFSCWNTDDPNRVLLNDLTLATPAFRRAMMVACGVVDGRDGFAEDPTGGATHYHNTAVAPPWAQGHRPSARIGRHLFFNDIE
ncbi:cell wall hydrolase [Roseospirillum parvum]|uniref:Cell Wall Hydrolase n=1 Tax=Roseospirillum parvum TaxID=83401 RepID=A0A1G8EYP9_9PROT|nr:cell wall hydrolase [Roseospirillum parvum]SDH75025.1 Cell Wall Hydrolase [Roseospirillum parvum]